MRQGFELSFDSDSEFEFFELEIRIPSYYPCFKSESWPIIEKDTYPEILSQKFTKNIQDNMSTVMNLDKLTFINLLKHFKDKRHFMTYFHFPQNEYFKSFSNYKLLGNRSFYMNKIEVHAKKLSKIISNYFNEPRKKTSDILFINQFKSLLEDEFPKKSSAVRCFFKLEPKSFQDFINLFSNQAEIIKKFEFNKAFHSEKNKLDPDEKYKSDLLIKLNNSFWRETANELSESIPSYFETMNEIEIINKINQLIESFTTRDKVRCLLKIEDNSFKRVVKLFLNQKDFCQAFVLDPSDLNKLKKKNQTKLLILSSKDSYRESHGVFLSENNKLVINKYSSLPTSERLGLNKKERLNKSKKKGKIIFRQPSKKLKCQNNNLSTSHQTSLKSDAFLNRDNPANNIMSPSLFFASRSPQNTYFNSRFLQDTTTPIQDCDEKISTSNMLSNKPEHFYDTPEIPSFITSPLENIENLSSETNNFNTFWSTNYLLSQGINYTDENEEADEVISFSKGN